MVLLVTQAHRGHAQFPNLPFNIGPPGAGSSSSNGVSASTSSLSSTLEDAIRGLTQNGDRPSMALIDRERAKSMSYDNELKRVDTYFKKRQLNRQYRAAEKGPRRTMADIEASRKASLPDRLTIAEYDAYRGLIRWPVIIRDQRFAAQRSKLDTLFSKHAAEGGGINTFQYASIISEIDQLVSALAKNYRQLNGDQYVYTQRFLKSLRYEASFAVGT
ncbi:MAG: hypothetical protein AAGC97_02130 [Planctomycetota bacterium]